MTLILVVLGICDNMGFDTNVLFSHKTPKALMFLSERPYANIKWEQKNVIIFIFYVSLNQFDNQCEKN